MNEGLKISADLILPVEAVTQKFAFLGRTGSGKSYAATKLCELMLEVGAQVIALDPVGVWWGLRTGGKGSSFSIPVFGGLHGDIPLDQESGGLMADVIADRGISAVLDVSQMLAAEQARFAHRFATRFFQRKKALPSPVHLFIEECQEFVPQNLTGRGQGGFEAMMLGAFERLIKLGRNFGIGASLISQRPQEVNKKALNQTECLFAFQMTGPQEREAIRKWVDEKGSDINVVETLPKLKVGEPHVWSPQWLEISRTVEIARKRTADVSSTPKLGQTTVARELSSMDLEQLRASMAETIAEARENDPKELRGEIAGLKKEVAAREAEIAELKRRATDSTGLREDERKLLEQVKGWGSGFASRLETLGAEFAECLQGAVDRLEPFRAVVERANAVMQNTHNLHGRDVWCAWCHSHHPAPRDAAHKKALGCKAPDTAKPVGAALVARKADNSDRALAPNSDRALAPKGGIRRMMIALAQRPGLNAKQLGVRAGLSSKSGTFSAYLGRLRSDGLITEGRDHIRLTVGGAEQLGHYQPLPTGRALADYWIGELGSSGAARMLAVLVEAYPRELSKEELGSLADISSASGTFSTYLGKLRALELVDGKLMLKASSELAS